MAVENAIVADIYALPEDCIAIALSLTSPKDACRLSLVASNFHSAAQFNAVWERFLPPDYRDLISRAVNSADLLAFASKKDLYFHLCDHPIIIDGGAKSFSLEKRSGKKCYMLLARSLDIVWGEDPRYWKWIYLSTSRFSKAAELRNVCWLEIRGKISAKMLSPNTNYAAYLVFTIKSNSYDFESQPVEASVGISGQEAETRTVYLDLYGAERLRNRVGRRRIPWMAHAMRQIVNSPSENNAEHPKRRGGNDCWMEIELGEIFIRSGEEEECVEMSLMEVNGGHWKSGLIVQGIEIRPKEAQL